MKDLVPLIKQFQSACDLDDKFELADEIIVDLRPRLFLYLLGKLPFDAVDDVCQETIFAVSKSLQKLEATSENQVFGWCMGIAKHKISDFFRDTYSKYVVSEDEVMRELEASDSKMSASERAEHLDALEFLRTSSPDCYELLWERYVVGQSFEEIGEPLEINCAAASMRVRRCLEKAREILRKEM